jgi:GNAT superfamily N-acetyltransferase
MAGDLLIREAGAGDAEAIVKLIDALGYHVTRGEVDERLSNLRAYGQLALVAERRGVVGLLTTSIMRVLHRPRPVGRVSMLVVAPQVRGGGIGGALLADAENLLAGQGCGLIEVTSNRARERAHRFYERLGYERTSYRFAKKLQG